MTILRDDGGLIKQVNVPLRILFNQTGNQTKPLVSKAKLEQPRNKASQCHFCMCYKHLTNTNES